MLTHPTLLTKIVVNIAIGCIMTYIVYRDAKKNDIPHKDIWIVGTFLIPAVIAVYFLYTRVIRKGVRLTKRQSLLAARRHAQKARQKELRAEKEHIAKTQRGQTSEEKAQEEALRTQKLKELEEQRRYKHDLIAKKDESEKITNGLGR